MNFLRTFFFALAFFLAVSGVAIYLGNGWSSDLGGDPDEPAHAVTSLMVRDYLVAADHRAPGKFAGNYYEDFPKVALGHYPPFYYVLGSLVLLPAPRIDALIVLQAVFMAILSALIVAAGWRKMGPLPALCAALMTMLTPIMWKMGLHVMAEWLLACVCYLAVLAWVHFCRRPTVGRSLLFGLMAALAILTKGSGLMLGAIPPLVLVLRRRWPLLRSWAWWMSCVPVLLLAAPWMVLTAGMAKDGMTGMTVPQFFLAALSFYSGNLPVTFGWLWLALAGLGLGNWMWKAAKGRLDDMEATLLALIIGGVAVLLLIPVGLTSRYFVPVVPVLVMLAFAGAQLIADALPVRRPGGIVASGLMIVALGLVLSARGIPVKVVRGFSEAVIFVQSQPPSGKENFWLVSSDPRGEGAVIAEAAFRLSQRAPSPLRIYRAGKELGVSDWMGRDYKAAFSTEAEVLAHLEKLQVSWVFVDLSIPEKLSVAHEKLLETALRDAPDRWKLERRQPVTRQPGVTGELLLYRSLARTQISQARQSPSVPGVAP